MNVAGYEIVERISETDHSVVSRGVAPDGRRVIVKSMKGPYPSRGEIVRYRQEYEITRSLDLPGVIAAHDLLRHDHVLVMILEDFGGQSLRHLLASARLPLRDGLRIGARVARSLGEVHRRGVVHKDLNPANIVHNPRTDVLKLIDFGCATRQSGELAALSHPNTLEGTLAYLSPEQTGRTNRRIDHRTDLYALGVTLYELLAGELPFPTKDPLELLHCHLARTPRPLSETNPGVPTVVSAIVMRLLEKSAEDRYESAFGLAHDLERCLEGLTPDGTIAPFPLGERDASDVFRIPQRLYGRAREAEALVALFEAQSRRAAEEPALARAEAVLVEGPAGVGKSALVREILRPLTAHRGTFASGKFDQYKRDVPYGGLSMALAELMRQVLGETHESLARFRERLLAALGPNLALFASLVPEITRLVGDLPKAPLLGPAEAQNRLDHVVKAFIRVFCDVGPLVLFLDDLQWADDASLGLLERLLADDELGRLCLIGALRDNEVGPSHPLALALARLERGGTPVHRLALGPLGLGPVVELVSDTLRQSTADVLPLVSLLVQKTQGNPFFLGELLRALHRDGLVHFDHGVMRWRWDLARIEAVGSTDNVIDLLLASMVRLPAEARKALHLAACVGGSFELSVLARVADKAPRAVMADLEPAITAGMIHAAARIDLGPGEALVADLVVPGYKFQHDRVQQAAYNLESAEETRRIRLGIGRMLLAEAGPEGLAERLFTVVDHLDHGRELMENAAERLALARLNLDAARRAKTAAAYAAAKRYLVAGIGLLPGGGWADEESLALALHRELAEAEYLLGDLNEAERLVEIVLSRARTPVEKAEIHNLLLVLHTMQGRYDRGVGAAHEGLALLGTILPQEGKREAFLDELSAIEALIAGRPIASLAAIDETTDPTTRLLVELLANVCPPYYAFDLETFHILAAKIVRISLTRGMAPASPYGFVALGIPLGSILGQYEKAHELTELALRLADRFHNGSQRCRAGLLLGSSIHHFVRKLHGANAVFEDAYRAGLGAGEIQFAGYCLAHKVPILFYQGMPLGELAAEIGRYAHFGRKTRNYWAIDTMEAFALLVSDLSGSAPEGGEQAEARFRDACREHQNLQALVMYEIARARELFVDGRIDEAARALAAAEPLVGYVEPLGLVSAVQYHFARALVSAARLRDASKEEWAGLHAVLVEADARFTRWAQICPENFEHLGAMIAAERARIEGDKARAVELYDRAITAARATEIAPDVALAHELAARFWLAEGRPHYARPHVVEAHYHHRLWGATRRVSALEQAHADAFVEGRAAVTSTLTASGSTTRRGEVFDALALVRASQALSGEIHLGRLLEALMRILLEVSGARRGLVALVDAAGDLRIEAEGYAEPPSVSSLGGAPIEARDDVPRTCLAYVARSHESVILDDAHQEGPFLGDPHIETRAIRSLLCTPILHQGKLLGLLYLEHERLARVFTPARAEVLGVLSAQAAISLENARIYGNLERLVEERTAELRAANASLVRTNAELDAFARTVAHDLKQPLNVVVGYASLLVNDLPDVPADELVDLCRRIESTGRKMTDIVNALLLLARVHRGGAETSTLDMGKVVAQALELVKAQAGARGAAVEVPERFPPAVGYGPWVESVWVNYISNGLKYGGDSPRLTLGARLVEGGKVRYWVEDRGPGITADAQKSLFLPFTRLDPERASGHGLGLSIVQRIVERLGGEVGVESTPGRGSIFFFTLPSA
ncbi:ATP-binding sensor histidine kinase [Polyangium sp. y55x31]|uniref:ATP-binding sensor histidine kinase n=1 Tax=Polyangium sp. y55x31 TaxID=3042688 RepID=UPI002482D5B2|nr:ATP-binding sensor histidine kinase [Polyangium sp. y55x31]MDI1483784.1 trifunctional serine/threonine-protein kinase/ATP-binding protein/sensor histidine kinase [Polyangium sp. y55x31]